MAHLLRLIAPFLALVLYFLAQSATAALPAPATSWRISNGGITTGYGAKSAACNEWLSTRKGQLGSNYTFQILSTDPTCQYQWFNNGSPASSVSALSYEAALVCQSGAEKVGNECVCSAGYDEFQNQCLPQCASGWTRDSQGMCKRDNPCPAGQHEEGGACVPDACKPNEVRVNGVCVKEPDCPAGETRVNGVCKKNGCEPGKTLGDYETNGESTTFYCEPYGGKNCTVRVNPGVCVTVDGVSSCWGSGRMTGATCTPGNGNGDSGNGPGEGPGGDDGGGGGDGPGNGGSGPGNSGNGPGSGNNDGPGTGPTQPPVSPPPPVPPDPNTGKCPPGTERYPNGNCYAPTPPPTNPDNDGKCPPGTVKVGGQCVSPSPPGKPVPDTGTPENPNPVGGGGGNGDGDGDGDGDSMFTGSCMGGFTCEGDAIQCAMAREQHRMNCKLMDTENVDSFWRSAIDGTDPKSADKLRENAQQVSVGSFDQQGLGWSRACPPNPRFDIVGESFEIPFNKVCGPLGVLSYAALGLTLLSCLLWVVGKKD